MKGSGLSTGRAAELCSVDPDTVLKWIKRGRLAATRTAGGHYRIAEQDLAALIPERKVIEPSGRPLRCWEYLSPSGTVRAECRKCVVYQIRAAWCFQVTRLGCEIGQAKNLCQSPCEECAYFRRVTGQKTNVLVITKDAQFVEALRGGSREDLALRIAPNAYEASAAIGQFQPAFAVVDQETLAHDDSLLNSLAADPRVPGLRVIVAVTERGSRGLPLRDRRIVAVLEKPFGKKRIAEIVSLFPVEPGPAGDNQINATDPSAR